ncbi:MAG: DJ-1/PfpI family protein [Pseudomonadota bacterium]
MKIQMFIYPGMTLLDLVGPLQVWNSWPGAEFQLVGENKGVVATDSALSVHATHVFGDAWSDPDILFVPGGTEGTFALLESNTVIDFLADRGHRAGWVTSVCSGSVVLAAAGLLDGYRATSHWMARDMLAAFGAEVVSDRWVIDRNRASGGGVTAGIDFGLAIMAHVTKNEAMAKAIQLMLEYAPEPPFTSGSPELAEPHILQATMDRFNSIAPEERERQLATAVARFKKIKV